MLAQRRLPVIFAVTLGVALAIGLIAVLSIRVAFGDEWNGPGLDGGQHLLEEASISVDEAVAIAQEQANGRVDDVELDRSGDRLVYEIEVGEADIYVDANDGSVLGTDWDDEDNDRWDDDLPANAEPAISAEDAVAIAEAEVDGTAHDVELDTELGKLIYSVEIGNQEVIIDAMTGDVLATEFDD